MPRRTPGAARFNFSTMHSNFFPSRRTRPVEHKLPDVAERPASDIPCNADALSDQAAFKVLLKRNMRPATPPADLLDRIRTRIEEIKRD